MVQRHSCQAVLPDFERQCERTGVPGLKKLQKVGFARDLDEGSARGVACSAKQDQKQKSLIRALGG